MLDGKVLPASLVAHRGHLRIVRFMHLALLERFCASKQVK